MITLFREKKIEDICGNLSIPWVLKYQTIHTKVNRFVFNYDGIEPCDQINCDNSAVYYTLALDKGVFSNKTGCSSCYQYNTILDKEVFAICGSAFVILKIVKPAINYALILLRRQVLTTYTNSFCVGCKIANAMPSSMLCAECVNNKQKILLFLIILQKIHKDLLQYTLDNALLSQLCD